MYGLDLLDFIRGRHSWRKLRVLLSDLPPSSAYVEAVSDDPEYAAVVVDTPTPTDRGPRLSQWSAEVDMLARVVDRLGEVIAVTVAAAGGKPGRLHTEPRPRTAIDQARADRRLRRHLDLVDEVRQAQERIPVSGGG